MMVIRAFNMQPFEEERFDKANQDLTSTMLFINRVMVVMMPVMMLIMNGCHAADHLGGRAPGGPIAQMQVGDMMAFMQYAMQILFAFLMLSMMFIILPRASVSGDRIADVLETEPVIKDPQEPRQVSRAFQGHDRVPQCQFPLPRRRGGCAARHQLHRPARPDHGLHRHHRLGKIHHRQPDPALLRGHARAPSWWMASISARSRSTTCATGSAIVPQKSNLFSGTIESNLRYADENASDEVLKLAADIAQASEFIDAKAGRDCSPRSPRAARTSPAGRNSAWPSPVPWSRRRPSISSTTAFRPWISRPTRPCARRSRNTPAHSTLLIVTQRIATIKNAEQIIVLDEGRIVGKGTHHELMKDCEVYREHCPVAVEQGGIGMMHGSGTSTTIPRRPKADARPRSDGRRPDGHDAKGEKPANFKGTLKKLIQYLGQVHG